MRPMRHPLALAIVLLFSCAAAAQDEAPTAKPGAASTLRVVVLDSQGKPLPGANIKASIWSEEKSFKANRDYQTDPAGVAQVELPKTFYIVRLWASKQTLVTMFANWERNELTSNPLPAEYTFRLGPPVSAGGRVVDEEGKPIANAKVQVSLANDLKPTDGDGRARYSEWLAHGSDAAITDADGRWQIDNVPDHPQAELSLMVSHPDYVSDEYWKQSQKVAGITTAMLRQQTAILQLKRGVIVRGRVMDSAARPIKDAVVVLGDDPTKIFPTDADGQFQLRPLAPQLITLTVIATGFAPQLHKLNLQAGLPPQEFRLESGKPIHLRVVDAAGAPIPRAFVNLIEWKGSRSLQSIHNANRPQASDTAVPKRTDEDGLWQWPWAPDAPVKLQITSTGFAVCEFEIGGGAPERRVVLKPEHRVTGRVVDKATGQPIPAFAIIPIDVFRKDWLHAERGNAVKGKDGQLNYLATRTDIPLRLRVEAPGYRTQDGPEFRVGDDAARTQDFQLQPSPPITGVVLDASGQPAPKTEVLVATPTQPAEFESDWGNHKTVTDATGRFTFPDPGEPFVVIARSAAGFAISEEFPITQHETSTMKLRPWATVSGRFHDGGQPVLGATILLAPIRINSFDRPRIDATMQISTGADGRFEFARVPPGLVNLRVSLGPWRDEGFRSGPSLPLDLKPGQRAELDLGVGGANITGRVKLVGKVPANLDTTFSLNYLVRRAPGITPPAEVAKLGFDIRDGWQDTWTKTIEGLAYFSTLQSWFVKLTPEGTFRVSGVPPGEYDLAVAVYSKPDG